MNAHQTTETQRTGNGAMIKRWFQDLITWAYVKYVFMPLLHEEMESFPEMKNCRVRVVSPEDIAMEEKVHSTLQ